MSAINRYKELLTGKGVDGIENKKVDALGKAQFLGYNKALMDRKINALEKSKNKPEDLQNFKNSSRALGDAFTIERDNYADYAKKEKKEKIKSALTRAGTAGGILGGAYGMSKVLRKTASEMYYEEKLANFGGALKRTAIGTIGGAAIGGENARQKAEDTPGADEESTLNNTLGGAASGALLGGAALGIGGGALNKGISGAKNIVKKIPGAIKFASEAYYDEKLAAMNVPTEEEKKKVVNIATSDDNEDKVCCNEVDQKPPTGNKRNSDINLREDENQKDPDIIPSR